MPDQINWVDVLNDIKSGAVDAKEISKNLTPEEQKQFFDFQQMQSKQTKQDAVGPPGAHWYNDLVNGNASYDSTAMRKDNTVGGLPPEAVAGMGGAALKGAALGAGQVLPKMGGELADFAKMALKGKAFEALGLPPWMAMMTGGRGGGRGPSMGEMGGLAADEALPSFGGKVEPSMNEPFSPESNPLPFRMSKPEPFEAPIPQGTPDLHRPFSSNPADWKGFGRFGGPGTNIGANPMGNSAFEDAEKATSEGMDSLNRDMKPGDFQQQLKDSLDVRRKKPTP